MWNIHLAIYFTIVKTWLYRWSCTILLLINWAKLTTNLTASPYPHFTMAPCPSSVLLTPLLVKQSVSLKPRQHSLYFTLAIHFQSSVIKRCVAKYNIGYYNTPRREGGLSDLWDWQARKSLTLKEYICNTVYLSLSHPPPHEDIGVQEEVGG